MHYALATAATTILRMVLEGLSRGCELLGAVFINDLHIAQVLFVWCEALSLLPVELIWKVMLMMYDLWSVPASLIALFPLLDFCRVKCNDTFLPLQKLYDVTGSVPIMLLLLVQFTCCYHRLNAFLFARDLHWILTLSVVQALYLVLFNNGSGGNGFLFLHLFLHLNLHDLVQLADESDISSYKTRVDSTLLLKLADQIALCGLLWRIMRSYLSTRA